jgi:hypothetical protein
MTMSDFKAEITLENPGHDRIDVTIRRGMLLENQFPSQRIQNLMVASDCVISVPPHGRVTVEIDCYCANRGFSAPNGTPMSVTPFVAKADLNSQVGTWAYFSSQR